MADTISIDAVLTGQVLLVSPEFDAKVNKGDGCWEWRGALQTSGYPKFSVKAKWKSATRIAYAFLHGPLPDGIYVCHTCDNPKCVRPDHLFAGTAADNNRDMWEKGRGVTNGTPQPGEANPASVLTEREVETVRRLVAANVSQVVVAAALGVSPSTISDIIRGKKWATT